MNKKSRKYFFNSMIICSFFIILIMGFTIVEKNAQSVISENNMSLVSYMDKDSENKIFKIHILGKDLIFYF